MQAYNLRVLHVQGLAMNAASLSRIVAGCCQSRQCEEAYAGWVMMQAAGVQPDTACLNALLAALRGAKQWQHAVHVFQAARQAQVALGLLCSAHDCLCCSLLEVCCHWLPLRGHAAAPVPCPALPGMLLHVLDDISPVDYLLCQIHNVLHSQCMHLSGAVHVMSVLVGLINLTFWFKHII